MPIGTAVFFVEVCKGLLQANHRDPAMMSDFVTHTNGGRLKDRLGMVHMFRNRTFPGIFKPETFALKTEFPATSISNWSESFVFTKSINGQIESFCCLDHFILILGTNRNHCPCLAFSKQKASNRPDSPRSFKEMDAPKPLASKSISDKQTNNPPSAIS
jgi:hypothetical protein